MDTGSQSSQTDCCNLTTAKVKKSTCSKKKKASESTTDNLCVSSLCSPKSSKQSGSQEDKANLLVIGIIPEVLINVVLCKMK